MSSVDVKAAVQFLDTVFGSRQGHVAVAYKDKGESWQEHQFAWPANRKNLIAWAEIHHEANLFICPALRKDRTTRKKMDGVGLRWLWADVDWDKVPSEKRSAVEQRIIELGTMIISSGTGRNKHVYVDLGEEVTVEEHRRLNTGLRDYLYADNKQADNSLLRLPGSTNWKTAAGSPVRFDGGHGLVRGVKLLMRKSAFRNAKVIEDASTVEWTPADVSGLPRRIKAWASMPVDEAISRYGTRHAAVWAVAGDMHKRGLDGDQIHTLMDQFPAALSKNDDEHNGYDVHKDIEKRLIWDRANTPELMEDDEAEAALEEDVFELVTAEDDLAMFEERVNQKVADELERLEVRKRARIVEAQRAWVEPPADVSWSLTDALNDPPRPIPHLIHGLCGEKHNVVITAQYKVGKTAFTMGCVASALADGEDFLGKYPVNSAVVVGHWNCEMDASEMMDDYIRPVGIDHTDNLHVANLRGYRVNILAPFGKQWAVNWLRDRKVKVWTIDSFARLARMAGVSEKDNDEVMSLLMALDEIKVEAEVDVLFLITHTGRAEQEEGKERARGATAIDDWADARWIMVKVDQVRTLRVEGRGVAMEETPLIYDEKTKRSIAGYGNRAAIKEDGGNQAIMRIVAAHEGMTQAELYTALKGSMSQRVAAHHIQEAVEANLIEIREETRGRGKKAKCHYLTGSTKGETRHHNATPALVDMRAAGRSRMDGGASGVRGRRKKTTSD